ncbi:MAG: glycosyltransferase family 2 protein [Bacteroidetes bacterium]|nr:glycosyltransferase family 2 protein [Bacteroidota bacterium]
MHQLTVTIITYNEEKNIRRCLDSVKELADEVVVVDSESTDSTVEICKESGCRVFIRKFDGYGQQKQFGVDQSKNNWILSMDADEIVTEKLKNEIKDLLGQEQPPHNGYFVPFNLYYSGKILRFARISPNLRLFNRQYGKFNHKIVHEEVEVNGTVGFLKEKAVHYSYQNLHHHIEKLNTYSTQAAEGNIKKGSTFGKYWVPLKFPVSFFTFYIIRGSFLDGYPGFIWAFMAAFYGSLKIAKTIEMIEGQRDKGTEAQRHRGAE